MQCARKAFKSYLCQYYSSTSTYVVEQLKNRSLLRVSGNDASTLLQGLITNDMQHLNHGPGCMFAMFLNNKGRVLYDTIIYRTTSDDTFYVEVDTQASEVLMKHLSVYRLRRKIDITCIDDQIKLWVHFNPNLSSNQNISKEKTIEGQIVPCTSLEESSPEKNLLSRSLGDKELFIFKDPRLSALGSRIFAPSDCDSKLTELYTTVKQPIYKKIRYKLGVGEGIEELPPGNCFPLEANCDYLHGVSFHKGCYIGQELTARTHHTGVVRKRLMPLFFESSLTNNPQKDEIIKSDDANVGKLRGFEQDCGLGLLRIVQALNKKLIVDKNSATTVVPHWWPKEVKKERVSSGKP